MTPVLVLIFGIAPQTAVGTDLLFASITKSIGVGVHGARGSIDWLVLRRLCAGSLPATILTLLMMHYFPENGGLKSIILPGLGGVLVLTSLAMIFQSKLHRLGQRLRATAPERAPTVRRGRTSPRGPQGNGTTRPRAARPP